MSILCSISTRGRYYTTLPLAIQSVIFQTKKPDRLIIFDDNDEPKDLREIQLYNYLFQMLDLSGISWSVEFGERKGQHFNHQRANKMGFDWVWRLDDDTIAEPDVLEKLYGVLTTSPEISGFGHSGGQWRPGHENSLIGAVGGSILTPPCDMQPIEVTGKIENIAIEPNIQWAPISKTKEVDHLHCSFLYRAGIVDYDLTLSKVAHREESLFSYNLKQKGYKILVTPAVTWHLKNKEGGIRDGQAELFAHDEKIFWAKLNHTIVILDNGMGDHLVFKKILPEIKNPLIYSCYPEIIPGKSIGEAYTTFGDIMPYNIYAKMDEWKWTGSLEDAFRKFYGIEK